MASSIGRRQLYNGLILASENLKKNLDLLNSINVFPIPDQDTGSNMSRSISEAIENVSKDQTCVEMLNTVADGLLHHGKGNSGTILTLFFQGLAKTINELQADSEEDVITSYSLAKGFLSGAANAFAGVANPMDGTILTIAQKAGEEALAFNASSHATAEVMTRMTEEAYSVLPLTAVLNPVLAEYNVIDSGALGFCMIMDGLETAFHDRGTIARDYSFVQGLGKEVKAPELTYQFCTEFIIDKAKSETPDILTRQLSNLGDCIVPVESDTDLKMHIHTNKPDAVFFIASLCGPIKMTKVDNMLLQSRGGDKPVKMFLCNDELTYDGLLSMELDNVFLDDGNRDAFNEAIESYINDGRKVTLFTSAIVAGPIADKIPVIRFFTDDNDLLNFVFSLE